VAASSRELPLALASAIGVGATAPAVPAGARPSRIGNQPYYLMPFLL